MPSLKLLSVLSVSNVAVWSFVQNCNFAILGFRVPVSLLRGGLNITEIVASVPFPCFALEILATIHSKFSTCWIAFSFAKSIILRC